MKYHDRKDYRNDLGRVLEFVTRDEETDVFVTVKIQFYDGISVARFVTEVENRGAEEQTQLSDVMRKSEEYSRFCHEEPRTTLF